MGPLPESLLVTAGGSENPGLLQVLADVFGVPVRTIAIRDSAALGAALRAAHLFLREQGTPRSWRDLAAPLTNTFSGEVRPRPEAPEVYSRAGGFLELYAREEARALEALGGA